MIHIQQVTDIERLLKMRMEVLKCVFELPDDYDMRGLLQANRRFYEQTLANGSHVSLEAFYVPDKGNKDSTKDVEVKDKDLETVSINENLSRTEPSEVQADNHSIAFALSEDLVAVDPDSFMDDSDYEWELELEEISISNPKPFSKNTGSKNTASEEDKDEDKDTVKKGYLCASADLCFYQEMPSPDNPTGECAYIMNVYVRPQFRSKGIASSLVKELIKIAHARGSGKVYLESTKMARPLYKSLGFCDMEDMMHLPID